MLRRLRTDAKDLQWLGDLDSPFVSAMADCISSQWKVDPLFIREGGSIPSLPFLEREFAADAIHFPMGTSTDSAHLPDERIRVLNLEVRPVGSSLRLLLLRADDSVLAEWQGDRLGVVQQDRLIQPVDSRSHLSIRSCRFPFFLDTLRPHILPRQSIPRDVLTNLDAQFAHPDFSLPSQLLAQHRFEIRQYRVAEGKA